MILITNVEVYNPTYIGKKDVLLDSSKIVAIEDEISLELNSAFETIEGYGLLLTPGFVDSHVHIAGAGGEGGPSSRTPETQLGMLIKGGVTTVVGCLGTDGITRSVESVLMKAKGLRLEGVSCWIYTGSYQIPTPTITGDVGRDLALIDEVIGVGEVAISDHRSSCPTIAELIRLAAQAKVGGMLGGKAGIVNLHMGDAKNPFDPIHQVVNNSELKYGQFLPTHCNRNDYIFEDAKEYGKKGWVDITTSSYPYFSQYEVKPSKAIKELVGAGVPIENITFSSDACGSLPDFDPVTGELRQLEMGFPDSNLREVRDAVMQEGIPLCTALKVVTSNPAKALKLKSKGEVRSGMDADVLLFDKKLRLHTVIAMGQVLMKDYKILKKGHYEKD